MAAKKRNDAQRKEDFVEIEIMSHRNMSQAKIAKALSDMRPYSVTQQMISEDMKDLKAMWTANAAIDINTEKGRLKSHLEHLISECYKAWDRSQEDAIREIEGYSKTQGKYTQTVTEGQTGDARFISEIRALLKQYQELFGLDAPKKIEGEFTTPLPANAEARLAEIYDELRKRKND